MTQDDLAKRRLLKSVDKDLMLDVDGFYKWWPEASGAHYNAWMLRLIADELETRNKDWMDKITAYFADH